jgi:hypothetical protein
VSCSGEEGSDGEEFPVLVVVSEVCCCVGDEEEENGGRVSKTVYHSRILVDLLLERRDLE